MSDDPQAGALDPGDRDAMVRTVIAEGGGSPDGWGAVANTIKNRLATGKFGPTPAAVVHAPGQFEVWADGSAANIDPASPQYAAAGRVVDAVAAGAAPDNTGGATHFFSPSGQAARAGDGRQQVPSWAKNQTASIGGNVFFAPDGRVTYHGQPTTPSSTPPSVAPTSPGITFGGQQDAPDPGPAPAPAPTPAATSAPAPTQAAAPDGSDATFARWGVGLGAGASPSPAPMAAALSPKPAGEDATFARWGVAPTAAAKAADPAPVSFNAPDAAAAPSGAAPAPINSPAAAAVTGAIKGIPIAGPALLGGLQRATAWARSNDYGTPYGDELANVQGADAAREADHPVASTVGRVGGAVLAMAPAVAAAPGLLGAAGSLGERMTMGGLSGAAIGAADARARDENPLTGAAFGGVGGALGAPVGNAIGTYAGKAGNALMSAGGTVANLVQTGTASGLPGYSRAASNLLTKAAGYDGGGAALETAAAALGPDATLMDVGPSMKGLALGVTAKPSEAKSLVESFVNGRAAGSDDRVMNQLGASIGPDRDPVRIASDIAAARTAATSPVYSRVLADAPPVDVGGVVRGIDNVLPTATGAQERALTYIRNQLVLDPGGTDAITGATIAPTYETNASRLLNLRQEIDNTVQHDTPGLGVPASSLQRAQASIQATRGSLDGALKGQVPGLADVDAAFAHSADVQSAVDNGFNKVLRADGPHPETFASDRAGMNPDVAQGENLGLAGRVYRTFGTGTQRDAVKLNRLLAGGDDGYNTQNLRTAFGDEPVSALLDTVTRERAFTDTVNKIAQNSVTARVQGGAKMLEDAEPGSTNLLNASLTGVGLQSAKAALVDPLVRAVMSNPNAPMALEVARALAAQGATRTEIATQIARLGTQQGAISSGSNALLRIGNRAGQSAIAGAGETNRTQSVPPVNLLTGG